MMEWGIVIASVMVVVAILILVNGKNRKDRKELTNKLNKDYLKSNDEEELPTDGESK